MSKIFANPNSISARLIIIGLLILILMIPSLMVNSLIAERSNRRIQAVDEVTSKWAGVQKIGGPIITVPFDRYVSSNKGQGGLETGYLHFLPDTLKIQGNITSDVRRRGIYKVALYNSKLAITGNFSFTKAGTVAVNYQRIRWGEAFVEIQVPDIRGIRENVVLGWNGARLLLEPGIRSGGVFPTGISARLPLGPDAIDRSNPFSVKLDLNGSEELNFLPLGRTTTVNLKSDWRHPSFNGASLPEKRNIDKTGFTAQWKILDLSRNYPQQWANAMHNAVCQESAFGVRLFSPVNEYTQIARANKYFFMFVSLTFLIFFLIEVFNKKRIHPIQYLLVGLALCIFYILLLSLSEHIPFLLAYLTASICVITLIAYYVRNTFGGEKLALITGALLLALYIYLFVLLESQDYALLLGAIGVFAILAAVMHLSRNVDWYKIELKQ